MTIPIAQVIAEIQEEFGNHVDLSASGVHRLLQMPNRSILAAEEWEQEPQEVLITTPAEVTGTDAGLTQDSATVTTASAVAAWVGRFFRKGSNKEFFEITAQSAGVSITLELAWPFAAASSQAFTVFPRLITPHADAQDILEVWGDDRLESRSLVWLNDQDPARTDTSDMPEFWIPAQRSSRDVPRIEVYPRPSNAAVLRVVYTRSGVISGDGTIPIYPAHLLTLYGASACATRLFALTNEQSWRRIATEKFQQYKIELAEAIMQNRGRVQKKSKVLKPEMPFPTDYALTHDVWWNT